MNSDTPKTDAHMDLRRKTYGASASSPTAEFCFNLERENSKLTDALDMMRDEFQRIIACPGCNSEIEDLANRAQLKLIQNVPVITQRDNAERQVSVLRLLAGDLLAVLQEAVFVAEKRGAEPLGLAPLKKLIVVTKTNHNLP